jgi:NADH-quinone oxidoreductase subunit L
MRGPVLVLAVPSALLGFVGLWPAFGHSLGADGPVAHLGPSVVIPLVFAIGGVAVAWRRDPAVDPMLSSPLRRPLANALYLDAVQEALVVRPVTALARTTRRVDESIVDGVVESTGAGAVGVGGLLARAHRATLPRAATAVLGGAVLIGLVAAVVLGAMS